jgi:DNA-binding winged helix-turn-helix (wHTH) protein
MSLVIFTPENATAGALMKALKPLNQALESHVGEALDEKTAQKAAAVICVITDKNRDMLAALAREVPVFGIDMPEGEGQPLQDDLIYYQKAPVRFGGLVNAVRNHLRARQHKDKMKPVKMGAYVLDPKTNSLTLPKKGAVKKTKSVRLTEKEQDMVLFLYEKGGKAATRRELLDAVWGYAQGVETHTLETHIYRLRQKVEQDPSSPSFLVTQDDGYLLQF